MNATINFRKNLRTAMRKRGLSQRKIAEKADLSYPYVNRILRGRATPAIDICDTLADALGLSLNQMLRRPQEFAKEI